MMAPMWTFAGKDNPKDMLKGTTTGSWQKTEKGWPDKWTWRRWARSFVKHVRAQGLSKALLYCDNADPHMDPVVLGEFRENKVTLSGLSAGGTGIKQPLDCRYFGNVGPIMTRLVAADHAVLTEHNIGHYYERACEVWRKSRADVGESPLQAGFRKAGIIPWNPDSITDKQFGPSDARTGYSKGSAIVAKAKEISKKYGVYAAEEVKKAMEEVNPSATDVVKKGKAKAAEELAAWEASGEKDDGSYGAARFVYTSDSWRKAEDKKAQDKADEEARRLAEASKRAATAAAKKAEAEARSKEFKAKQAANKIKREAEKKSAAERKAKRQADKAAKAAAAAALKVAPKAPKKKAEQEAVGPVGKKAKHK